MIEIKHVKDFILRLKSKNARHDEEDRMEWVDVKKGKFQSNHSTLCWARKE